MIHRNKNVEQDLISKIQIIYSLIFDKNTYKYRSLFGYAKKL